MSSSEVEFVVVSQVGQEVVYLRTVSLLLGITQTEPLGTHKRDQTKYGKITRRVL